MIGGDCSSDLGPLRAAAHGPRVGTQGGHGRVGVLWLDAHADANSVASSPSGCLHGMALRAACEGLDLLDAGPLRGAAVDPACVVLAGCRETDAGEDDWLAHHPVRRLGVDALADPDAVARAVRDVACDALWIHVDVDVHDPSHGLPVGFPVPGGASPEQVVDAVRAASRSARVVGAFVGELMPDDGGAAPPETLRPLVDVLLEALARG